MACQADKKKAGFLSRPWNDRRSHFSPVTLKRPSDGEVLLLAKGPGVLKCRALSFRGLRGKWQYTCSPAAGFSLIEAQLALS
jgi:hypothetical protein